MTDKTREEFEAWYRKNRYANAEFELCTDGLYQDHCERSAQMAYQRQQAVIDALKKKMDAVFAGLDSEAFGQLPIEQEHHLQANALFKIRKILEGRK